MFLKNRTKFRAFGANIVVLCLFITEAAAAPQASPGDILCDPDYDVVFVPFSPISETDRFEVRIQVKTQRDKLPLAVDLYLDEPNEENKFISQRIILESGKWGLVKSFPDIRGKLGPHKIIVIFTTPDGRTKEVRKTFEVRKNSANLLDGAFISFGAPKNRSICNNFADVRQFTDEQWKQEMDNLAELGFKVIIPQNSLQMIDQNFQSTGEKNLCAYYQSKRFPKADIVAEDPFRAVLERAEHNGQIVFLPTGCVYLRLIPRGEEVMQELFERYGKYKSFYGWYEVAETGLGDKRNVDCFPKISADVRRKSAELSPAKPVLWSVGINRNENPTYGFQLLADGKIDFDILMPFDVVGCSGADPAQLEFNNRYMSALKLALAATNIHIWGNVESFEFGPDQRALVPRFSRGGFDGTLGFIQQIEAMRPFVEKIVTFQATSIFTKPNSEIVLGAEDATEMFQLYKKYSHSPRPIYKNLALGKPYHVTVESNTKAADNATDAGHLCTDGYIAGGFYDDIAKMHGYAASEDSPRVSIDFVLPAEEVIDRVRIYKCPEYKNDPQDCSPEKISVYLGNSPDALRLMAVLREYKYGWAEAYFQAGNKAKYVRLIFSKQRKPNQEGEVKMFINEVEFGRVVN